MLQHSWTLPKTVVHRAKKAITIQKTLDWLKQVPVRDHVLGQAATNSPEFLLVPRAANALPDQISAAIRQLAKAEDETLRLDLPEQLRAVLARPSGTRPTIWPWAASRSAPASRHGTSASSCGSCASGRADVMPSAIIVEQATADQIDKLLAPRPGHPADRRPAAGVLRGRHHRHPPAHLALRRGRRDRRGQLLGRMEAGPRWRSTDRSRAGHGRAQHARRLDAPGSRLPGGDALRRGGSQAARGDSPPAAPPPAASSSSAGRP